MTSKNKEIVNLFTSGKTQAEIARSLNVSRQRVHQVVSAAGLSRCDGGLAKRRENCQDHSESLLKWHLSGLKVREIAKKVKLSEKSTREIMDQIGIFTGIPPIGIVVNKVSDACCQKEWGLSIDTFLGISKKYPKAIAKFLQFKKNMRQMYPESAWTLSFGQWWGIWSESGQYAQMGASGKNYCMTRQNRDLGFFESNMKIVLFRNLFSKD